MVALAAGHRPCALCRREAFGAFQAAWAVAHGAARAPEIDRVLHAARVTRDRRQKRHEAWGEDLPAGSFVLDGGIATLLTGDGARRFAPSGYGPLRARPAGRMAVLTPAPLVAVLAQGYAPLLHATAQDR